MRYVLCTAARRYAPQACRRLRPSRHLSTVVQGSCMRGSQENRAGELRRSPTWMGGRVLGVSWTLGILEDGAPPVLLSGVSEYCYHPTYHSLLMMEPAIPCLRDMCVFAPLPGRWVRLSIHAGKSSIVDLANEHRLEHLATSIASYRTSSRFQ